MKHLIVAVALIVAAPFAQAHYTERMYVRSLTEASKGSMSPLFALITLQNRKTGSSRRVCIAATFLLGAIHREHAVAYDDAGGRKAMEIAIAQRTSRVFEFTRPNAIRNVQPGYTAEQLEEVRERLAGMSRSELRRQARTAGSPLERIHRRNHRDRAGFWASSEYRDAVAHVLLENGILVGIEHQTGNLYVD